MYVIKNIKGHFFSGFNSNTKACWTEHENKAWRSESPSEAKSQAQFLKLTDASVILQPVFIDPVSDAEYDSAPIEM